MKNFISNGTRKYLIGIFVLASIIILPTVSQGVTMAELQAQIAALTAQLQAMQGQGTATTPIVTSCPVINRDLGVGKTGPDVSALQQYLMDQGFLASDGTTGYFGQMTSNAVIAWKNANGLGSTHTSGYFGAIARAKLVKLCGAVPPAPACIEEGQSLGAVVPGNDHYCCAGLIEQAPNYGVGSRGTCVRPNSGITINSVSGPNSLNIGQQGTWAINVTASSGTNLTYSVYWDEMTGAGGGVTARANQATGFSHSYSQAGTYVVRFIVTDNLGGSAQSNITVVVGNNSSGITLSQNPNSPVPSLFLGYNAQNPSFPLLIGSYFVRASNGTNNPIWIQSWQVVARHSEKGNVWPNDGPIIGITPEGSAAGDTGFSYILTPGQTRNFKITASWNTGTLFNGPYTATLNGFGYNNTSTAGQAGFVNAQLTTNSQYVVGETSPWIEAMSNPVTVGGQVTISGSNFTASGNVVYVNPYLQIPVSSANGKTLVFNLPSNSSLSSGVYPVYVQNSRGKSNTVQLTVSAGNNNPGQGVPVVTINSSSLDFGYDAPSTASRQSLITNFNFGVQAQDGDIYLYKAGGFAGVWPVNSSVNRSIPDNCNRVVYPESKTSNVPVVTDSSGNQYYKINNGQKYVFYAQTSCYVDQMFSGVYYGKFGTLSYYRSPDINSGTYKELDFRTNGTKYIVGEKGPWISSVEVLPTSVGTVSQIKVRGERLSGMLYVAGRNADKFSMKMPYFAADGSYVLVDTGGEFPASSGSYPVYVENAVGRSNIVYVAIGNNNPPSTQPSITILSPNSGEAFSPGQPVSVKYSVNNFPRPINVQIQLNKGAIYPNGPYNPVGTATNYVPATGNYTFTIPISAGPAGNDYSFMISPDYPNTETAPHFQSNNFTVYPQLPVSTTTVTLAKGSVSLNNSVDPNTLSIGGDLAVKWNTGDMGANVSKVKVYACYNYTNIGFDSNKCKFITGELANTGATSLKFSDTLVPTPTNCLLTNKLYSIGIINAGTAQPVLMSKTFSLSGSMSNHACEAKVSANKLNQMASALSALQALVNKLK